MCYTGAVLVPCGFLLPFDVLRGALVWCHLGLCVARVGVVFLVRVLVVMVCPHVGQPLEVAQGPRLALYLGYAPLEVVSLVGGASLVNISVSFLSAAFCLPPNIVIGLVGVGLRRVRIMYVDECVDASCEDSLGQFSVARGNL